MACAGCSVDTKDGQPLGCRNNGNCSTGGCNKLNTYDWLSAMDMEDVEPFNVVEVSFKNGARKGFYYNQPYTRAITGDTVVVESKGGSDVGKISLSGELVRLQMRKKKIPADGYFPKVIRRANERDMEKLSEVREKEMPTMVRARAIARTLDLKMKVGDVEYQGDGRKATFYYTADGRVDFRELIRHYAKEFKIKVEMRQIGARQESARIGGLGPCGRELCCSTWLTTYRSVSTAAARYQNLAINQAKLSGQCGRLKCCLNYELDTYMEAISEFPENADKIMTEAGLAVLLKTDIFKGLMFYGYKKEAGRGRIYPLELEQVREVLEMNKRGEKPSGLADLQVLPDMDEDDEIGFADDVDNVIDLPMEERRRKKKKRKPRNRAGDKSKGGGQNQEARKSNSKPQNKPKPKAQAKNQGPKKEGGPEKGQGGKGKGGGNNRNRGRGRGRGRGKGGNNRNDGGGGKSNDQSKKD